MFSRSSDDLFSTVSPVQADMMVVIITAAFESYLKSL